MIGFGQVATVDPLSELGQSLACLAQFFCRGWQSRHRQQIVGRLHDADIADRYRVGNQLDRPPHKKLLVQCTNRVYKAILNECGTEAVTERLFKVLAADGYPCHGGSGLWALPVCGEPGEWMPLIECLAPCRRGYHLCRADDLMLWLGPTIWEAEARGERVECPDKVVVAEARLLRWLIWDERVARLFACDCADRVVHLCGDDPRPRAAIEVSRRYAQGGATAEELDAACAAAGAAAWSSARWSAAARYAASSAAGAATRYAAFVAWFAAGFDARSSADATACADARSAVSSAAWSAADATACADARSAELRWQVERLIQYLDGAV